MTKSHETAANLDSSNDAPAIHTEVVIDGVVYKKIILPAVTREVSLTRSGRIKPIAPKSRDLTGEESAFIESMRREERTFYDRMFSESGMRSDGGPQGDIAWDGGSHVYGDFIKDNSYPI